MENQNKDIRWYQRFANYSKAFSQLEKFIAKGEALNEMEEQGLIQSFENTFELAWNLIKDYYENQGETNIQGSRDAFRMAYNRGLIADGEGWMKMIESRTKTSHTCNEEIADEIASAIVSEYFSLFKVLHKKMGEMMNGQKNLFDISIYKYISNKDLLEHIQRVGIIFFKQPRL